jgi:enamine deaminase RidA (YjgF/YER057c/UK114 family)
MKIWLTSILTLWFLLTSVAPFPGLAPGQKQAEPAAKNAQSKPSFEIYHAGPWEQRIGYSQAVRSGHMLYISGTVGANAAGQPEDLNGQMKNAYAAIQNTLARYKTDFSHVVMERIYTTDIEALIRNHYVALVKMRLWM